MIVRISFNVHVYVHRGGTPKVDKNKEVGEVAQCSQVIFSTYAEEEIAHARKTHHYSTASNYATAIRSFFKFCNIKDLPLSAIDCRLIDAYGEWLLKEKISKNTLSCYMRSLRTIYNKAVRANLVEQCNPFCNVFTGVTCTKKRSIEKKDICKLHALKVKEGSFMEMVRDIFLFCFYACGMPFVDVAFLKKSQIADGYISYHRHKTNQFVQIKIEPCMRNIISRYKSDEREYVFPFLTSLDEETAYKEYQRKFSYYNKALKMVGEKAGISMRLSSYVARHTWATLAYQSLVDMPIISQALGHTNTKTTQIYVKNIGTEKQNAANKKMLKNILGSTPLYKSINSQNENRVL